MFAWRRLADQVPSEPASDRWGISYLVGSSPLASRSSRLLQRILIDRGSTMDQGFPPGSSVSAALSLGASVVVLALLAGARVEAPLRPPAPTRTWTTARSTTTRYCSVNGAGTSRRSRCG